MVKQVKECLGHTPCGALSSYHKKLFRSSVDYLKFARHQLHANSAHDMLKAYSS